MPQISNKTADYKLTIVIPFKDEKDNVAALEERLAAYLPLCHAAPACVLFVNDGSTDGGDALVREACLRHPDFFYADLECNNGLSGALKAGFDLCRSELAGYLDADLQTAPEDFDLLLDALGDHALSQGIRTGRKDGPIKRISSKIANGWRRMMTGDGATDTCCPLKVIRSEYARELPLFKGMHRFIPALVLMMGGTYCQTPVRHFPRTAGKAKYHLGNRLAGPFFDCFAYRWMRSRYTSNRIKDTNL